MLTETGYEGIISKVLNPPNAGSPREDHDLGTFLVHDFTGFDTLTVLHLLCKGHLPAFRISLSLAHQLLISAFTYLSWTCTNFNLPHSSTFTCLCFRLPQISTYLTPFHFSIHPRETLPKSTPARFNNHLPRLLLFLGSSEHQGLENTSDFHYGTKIDPKAHVSATPGNSYHRPYPSASTRID